MSVPMPVYPVRVLCAEDNELVAAVLLRKIEHDRRLSWMGWVNTARMLRDATSAFQPDVITMDLRLAGRDAMATIRELRAAGLQARILIFAGRVNAETIRAATHAGADGFLSKAEESRAVVPALLDVAHGPFVLGPVAGAYVLSGSGELALELPAPVRRSA